MAVIYAIYTPSLPLEVRCESGMYVCTCVCMYVCMYVHTTYVCTYVCMYVCMYVCLKCMPP